MAAQATRLGRLSQVYRLIVGQMDQRILPFVPQKIHGFWHGHAGPKTVFFWAPVFKWGLVIAGLGDLSRPAESLSVSQSASLFATGVIWSRYSLVIIPKNYGLFSVNVFVAGIQFVQLLRAYRHSQSQKEIEAKPVVAAIESVPANQ